MAQRSRKTETPNLSTSENVNMLSSTIQPASETGESFQETGDACKIQCDQNPDMSANRENENETLNSQQKKKKRKSAADTCKETTQPKQFLLEGEHTDTETRQFGDVDKETNCCSADTGDGANYYPKTTSDATDLQGTVDDGHPPKLTQEDQVPKSYSRVKDEANQGLALSEDGIVEQSAKATVANSVLHQYNKSADSTGDGILTPEKQRSGNESAKEGEANGETANNEENTHNQQDLKKKEGIPQTKKKKRKSAADTCKETTQPKQFLLKGEQTDTETRQFGDVDKETNCCSADTGDGANYYPKTTSDATDLQGTVDDGHPPKLTQEDQVPKSYSRVKDEANQGLALSEDGIVEQSAKATVANSVLHQYNNKSADSTGDGILTPEKQRSGNESAKEGEANGETANNEENTHNQQDLKKKEGIPQTKGQYSGTDNIKNLIQQHDSKTVEKKCTDNTSERPKQKSTEELTTSENSNTSTNEDKKTLSRKEKKQQKKHSKEVPSGFSYSKPEETILIYFYAILSDHFKLNPSKDKVFIRSGTLADDWKTDILEMNVVKKLEHHGYFIEGCHYVHKNKIGKKHPYKYVVIQGNKEVYEFIYKLDSPSDCIANRCLDIKQNLLVEGEWHQYDDIICAPPEKALTTRFWDAFKNKKNATRKGKQLAGKIMMESIFDTLTTWDERNLKNFLMRLQHFFAVYEIPMVFEQMPVKWVSLSFGKKEVQDILKSTLSKMVMHPNQDSVTKANSVQSCLRTGILTLYLTDNYSLEWSDSELAAVCDIFSVQQFPANIVANEVNTLKKTFCFGNGILVTLKQIIVRCIEHQILNWVHVIPVFHLFGFTSNVTRPDILASSQSEDSWDGLDGLPIITFRQKIDESKQRKLLELMGKTMHLMAVDKLLARSWFSLLPMTALPEYMEIITPDLFDVLHGIIQRLKYGCISDMKLLDHILKLAERSLNNQKRDMCGERLEACMKAIAEIHEMICKSLKKTNFIEVIASSVVLMSKFAALIKSSSKFADDKSQNEEGSEMASIYLRMMLTTTRQWLKVVLDSKLLINKVVSLNQDEFQVWVTLITLDLGNKKWTSFWRNELVSDLEGRMKKEKPDHQVVIYCKIFEETRHFHPLIAECFEKCALEAAHSMCQDKSEAQLLNKLSNYDLTKFGKLLSTIIENSWEKDYNGMFLEDYDSVLQHLLNWTASKTIFRLHGMNSQVTEGLSNKAKDLIALAEEVFHVVMSKLWEGSIKIKHLECILKKKSKFSALYMTKHNISFTDKNLNQLLIWRQNELNKFYEEIKCMESFLKMCRKIEEYVKVAIEELEKLVAADVCSMELSKVVTVKQITTDYLESNFPKITYFSLSEEIKEKARNIHTFEDSYILQMCWKKKVIHFCVEDGTVEDETPLPLEKVCSMIWDPCFDQYTGIFVKVKEASITFAEVDDIFKDYRDRYDDLRSDLKIMCRIDRNMKDDWIEERIRQIMEYHQLHLAVESAQVIKKIQSVLNLTGNFTVLETLLNMTDESYRHCHLECIDEQLIQAKKHLHKTKPCMEALKELTQSQQFVQWIKEALKDVNELKVFVDLASISAGENDLDVDRVACFHDAVLGYSSLLFEIQPTAGFVYFIHYLQKLQKALKNDPHLIKKLRDSARHLEWLKTVKESHGSIEQSSLALASSINNSGIYNISSHGKNKLSLGSVIILNLPETYDGKVEVRSYTLEDLKELQNKLMLMSGKGDHCREEVDRFVEVFANVQRLATSFISLFSAGNMLFRNLKVEVHCSKKCEACIIIDFNLKEVSNIKASGDVTEQLPILCKKMEAYLEVWKQYMDQHRSRYYYLNFYTAEQLVYLSTQLFDRNCNRQDVLMMLSFIKPNCTAKDIKVAQQKLFYGDARKRNKPLTDSVQPFTMRQVNIQDLAMEVKIDLVWKHYMENMTYFQSSCLDVSTLGKLLENVADSKQTVTRVLVPGFQKSQPNLVVCPHSDVLSSALSIYLHSSNQPLPTYDEVLLCTAETTYEQVDLFLRRCLTAGCMDSKIYSLLYADELTYDVSVRFEELFKILELTSQSDYKLVIFCSYEREHCYVPTAFSRHKVHMMPQVPLEKIQSYLENHYKISTDSSAATVFSDGMFIRIISSKRAGVGKSLYVKRLHEKLKQQTREENLLKTVHLLDTQVDENKVLQALFTFIKSSNGNEPLIFHFDITSSVQKGLCEFLFKLFILQYLMGTDEKMWKCSQRHLYVVEMLEGSGFLCKKQTRQGVQEPKHNFLDVFPKVFCRSPKEVLEQEVKKSETLSWGGIDPLMDKGEFRSEAFQRPYQYLREFKDNKNLDTFVYQGTVEGNHVECLQLFLIYCGVMDPSWSELRNFAWFLNLQLKDCETSVFCKYDLIQDILQGFKNFVVNFMILMARDFATPSLSISDQSSGIPATNLDGVTEDDIAPFLLRKKWESEPHPYIFFNADHASMTFIGFHLQVNKQGGVDAINPSNGKIIKSNIMTRQLYQGLLLQKVPFNIEFDKLPRSEKIEWVCTALGIEWPHDPDVTFELTTDNVLKILAIHMRFRCGIPVIIMGETGCGKTRLIKFLCELQKTGADTENMKLVKVHGGTTSDGIYAKIKEAEVLAEYNKQNFNLDTILFFDEANTTEAVSCIKEVVCDQMIEGIPLTPNTGLQIIAACNPYRKHTDEMIKRLESAGLGYRVRADETEDKLGSIPLRQLVYRVQALPPSMIPLVWDFGQLDDLTEKMYIQQIVQRLTQPISDSSLNVKCMVDTLSASQNFMRCQRDECSFVSLRDVERCMKVFIWFYSHRHMLLNNLKIIQQNDANEAISITLSDNVIWPFVLALGVCYHACLEKKTDYRNTICLCLPPPYNDPSIFLQKLELFQDLLLSGVPLRETIARNSALKENVFMMVICIELKIPLFLVGKPGSSKSLAKTIVADAMQGQAAHSELYKKLKQIHLVSFQCSPHSTSEGIINTFKQCARFQEGKNLDEYVSVVVLDEIGLAEDSPKMPLKTLHPLLEDGCIDDDHLKHKRVGFIGISNWALDPAKMNRGVFVSRGDPDRKELIESAKGISSSDPMIQNKMIGLFVNFAEAYLRICEQQSKEFFGLRDYYSLIKMVFSLSKVSKSEPTPEQLAEVVLRNFSGSDDVKVMDVFKSVLKNISHDSIKTLDLIRHNIYADSHEMECRYLLILTKNFAALQILQQMFFSNQHQPEIIFGSSFPKDQDYTQICRNINRVKTCMETGQMVVLLNLQNLYESLYDALNQYYVYLGGQKYVDLGLGTHRVKCRVHSNFRLMVIEEKEIVYREFPIPLINRLEKHYLDINTVLNKDQRRIVTCLEKWVQSFTAVRSSGQQRYDPPDVFVGYHSDTCSSVVLQITQRLKQTQRSWEVILKEAQWVLLNCATPDSVIRLAHSQLPAHEADVLMQQYFEEQHHDSLADFIQSHIKSGVPCWAVFTEVTTYSRLLTASDVEFLQKELGDSVQNIFLYSLQQFDTEHSFLKKIRHCIDYSPRNTILLIQTDFENSSQSANLIASAKYSTLNEISKNKRDNRTVYVYFLTKLSRIEGGSAYIGFQGDPWQSVHIDDLRKSKDMFADMTAFKDIPMSQLFGRDLEDPEPMIVNQKEAIFDETKILDTTILIRNCVQSAVGMLRDQHQNSNRSTARVEILLSLLSEDVEFKASFLALMKKRLHSLLLKRDAKSNNPSEWLIREASNVEALQEGGTFRHTLWKRIQTVVTPLLAQIISVIDRDCNLNLLSDDTPIFVRNLWIKFFKDANLLDLPYYRATLSVQSEIVVYNYMKMEILNISSRLPFSWKIKDFLDELWVQAQYMEGQNQHKLNEIFNKTGFGKYLSNIEEEWRQDLFFRYLHDFLLMSISISSESEFEFLQGALISCINQLKIESNIGDDVSLLWVHFAYQHFKNRLQNFSRIVVIHPSVLTLLQKKKDEIQEAENKEMVIDIYAAAACVEMLEFEHSELSYTTWLQMVNTLQMPIELVSAEVFSHCEGSKSSIANYVKCEWCRILSLSLFVEHIILGVEEIHVELPNKVVSYAGRLAKSLNSNSDVRSQGPFRAVVEVLRDCKNSAGLLFFRYGLKECRICLGELNNPVLLPCDHLYCLDCINKCLQTGQRKCPMLCSNDLDNGYIPVVSEEIREAVAKIGVFRKRCDAFFIALVSMVCFKDNSPPTKGVVDDLLSLMIVEKRGLPSISKKDHLFFTSNLSPFDDAVDRNPVVRSIVLKMLLKYSFDDIKNHMQDYLSEVQKTNFFGKENETELYALFLNCLEDSIYEKSQLCTEQEKIAYLAREGEFLLMYIHHKSKQTTIETLQIIARIRLCLDTASQLLCEKCDMLAQDLKHLYIQAKETFLHRVKHLIQNGKNEWFKIYLLRKMCSLNGIEFVQELSMDDRFSWLFPHEIILKRHNSGQLDRYLACGTNYQKFRDAVTKALVTGEFKSITEVQKGCKYSSNEQGVHVTLAIFREITMLYSSNQLTVHPNKDKCDMIEKYIENENLFHSTMCKNFAVGLLKNDIPGLEINPEQKSQEKMITEIIIHVAAILLCGERNGILAPLQNLSFQPADMVKAFLPTMPEDMITEARRWDDFKNVRWYQCPNGHPCAIGECGRPTVKSYCIECKAEIGGLHHIPVHGFTETPMKDKTQTGHILGDPNKRETTVALDKQMPLVSFLLMRLMTHVALFLGTIEDEKSIKLIIHPCVENPRAFLRHHIEKDIEQLKKSLEKTIDETAIVVHLILSQLIKQGQCPRREVGKFSTKDNRNSWEDFISKVVITPTVKDLDMMLGNVNRQISQDERICSDILVKTVYNDPQTFLRLPKESALHCSSIWSCRKRISIEHLRHIVEQKDVKDDVPILQTFLQKEPQLRLVKYLPELLALQYDLMKLFQNALEVPKQSIHDFLQTFSSELVKSTFTSQISAFIYVWNQLRTFLFSNGEIKIPEEYCALDLDMQNCQLEVLLPRRQGLGLCSTALVSYLIALQNYMVYAVEKYTPEYTLYSVSPQDVSELHVIRYEIGKDMIPLLSSNCQYTVEKGSEMVIEYDFNRIEQQLTNRFLKGKPLISLKGVPTLIYRQDRNYEIIFEDIKNKIVQESLPVSVINAISVELQSYNEVCEAFTAVEVTIGFLAMSGGDPDLELVVYLKEVLQMEAQTVPHVMDTLRRCKLKHIQALWQLLSSRKSECSLHLNRDPFSGIKAQYKTVLNGEAKKQLRAFFIQASVDIFILELHEMLILKCKNIQSSDYFDPSWSLKVCLEDFKEQDNLPELEDHFPETVSMSESVETWKAAVAFKREQSQFTR